MAATDDPFSCFGDDDDDDSDVGGNNREDALNHRARHLVENYNNAINKDHHLSSSDTSSNCKSSSADTLPPFCSSYEDQLLRTAALPWPHRPPLYLGPISLSDTLAEGGGRGLVATQDLLPGTCILIEEPLVKGWSEQQMGKRLGLESIQYLLDMNDAKSIVECMEELHPRKEKVDIIFREVSYQSDALDRSQIVDMISDMNSNNASHVQQVEALVKHAQKHNIKNSDGSPLDDRDINRLLLVLRYNGFDSGLYLHFSMFNHGEDPNCIKFRPTGEKEHYSEARTTRHTRKGEALTLHYLENPREVSHATRRKILWDQHRFDIGDEHAYTEFLDVTISKTGHLFNDNARGNNIFESELVLGKFPPSTREQQNRLGSGGDLPATFNIENTLDDLEVMLVELQAIFRVDDSGNSTCGDYFDRAAALELTICELTTASESTLGNNYHILLSRCRRLHLDAIELILSYCSPSLTEKHSIELMARFLSSVRHLLESQRRRLGNDHPDVARTYNDFSMGIQALLSHSPKRLLSLKLDEMNTLEKCSRKENHCRVEKNRIDELYPRDVDQILESVQKKS